MDIAISMGKTLLEKIQRLNTVAMSPSNVCNFTVSIGVNSVLPTEGNSFSKFMNLTDRVLYAAKESGKNTMVVNSMYP
ncbi:hypothetical protein JCM19235_5702 [Vibrio maritimus]|uniref:GGDEF domain-containing protein n=1 Tax=Vibrio maritimus TaxID=990268 RepID=A0A090RRF6_9VIBR|nr:hypothetical protein JCM19235_5702 [Vibrio maritimus]